MALVLSLPAPSSLSRIAVIGGGPAGLMAAEVLARGGATVTVYDRMSSVGRKFLLAGRGGLNLTHSEDLEHLIDRYGAAGPRLRSAVEAFAPAALRAWCEGLGQPTFVGSSGRVFPRAMKAAPLLRAWLARLVSLGVAFKPRHHWTGWDASDRLQFAVPGRVVVAADATVLALGGASWPRLGSDGEWAVPLAQAGVAVAPLKPANCAVVVAWSQVFRKRFAGHPLKRIAVSCAGRQARGEAIVTDAGLEGGAIYALSAPLRQALAAEAQVLLYVDLCPDLALADLCQQLAAPRAKQTLTTFLRKRAKLSPVAIGLLHEGGMAIPGGLARLSPAALARLIKAVPVCASGTAPIARAISTAGGIAFEAIDHSFMLCRKPGVFVAGEMLDWEAPTGGYLLQASFATGVAAASGALAWLAGARHTPR